MEATQIENTSTETSEVNLVEAVKKQVEYYFSKENLLIDPYLTSQMDAQMCVPINVVMKFAKLKALTQDEALLRKALVDSTIVSILDNKIKANIKPPGRSTIILREIPSDAPMEEVTEIFNYPGAKTTTSIRSEIGDTWFVTMDTEEDAKDTLLDLRLKKRTFRGVSVKARLKTETVVRSFFPVTAGAVAPFAGVMAQGMPVVDMRAFGYMGMPVPILGADVAGDANATAEAAPAVAAPASSAQETRSTPSKSAAPAAANAATGAAGNKGKGANGAAAKGAAAGSQATQGGRRQDGASSGAAGNNNARNGAKGSNAHGKDGKKEEAVARQPAIEINVANFPPLGGGEDLPVPTPGYKGPFQKYSADEIINIAKGVKETNLPASLKPQSHPLSMTVEANKDLLKRQRSFSIDETREQLRQGRPVTREAVLPGKVDSRSLYYGDEAPVAAVAVAAAAPKKEAAPAAPANTTPSQGKKVAAAAVVAPKETVVEAAAAPVAVANTAEASVAAAEIVDHVAAAAANLAITNPTVSESMHMASPQKITPSTWAAMLKSSAASATEVPAAVRAPVKEVRRTPAKEAKPAAAGKEKEAAKPATEGRNRRKNSEGSREGRPPKAAASSEGAAPSSNGSVASSNNNRRKATEPGTPSRSSTSNGADKTEGEVAKAETSVSWGGKASFANILKLSAESEAFVPAASAPAASKASSANKDTKRAAPATTTKAPAAAKTTAPAAAATTASGSEWSTSTGKSRTARDSTKEAPKADNKAATPAAGAGSTANSGANAKGAWARETLPVLAPADKV